jgi:multidrug resistance efflux pump
MAKKKKYNVHGTKDFLILTIVCGVLGVWAIRDAWFPSAKVLKKHPHELALSFDASGVVSKVFVTEGSSVKRGTKLAKLNTAIIEKSMQELERAYSAARDAGDEKVVAEKHQQIMLLARDLKSAELLVAAGYQMELDETGVPRVASACWSDGDPDFKTAYSLSEKSMIVKKVLVKHNHRVAAGEPVIIIDTKDHFYPFNKVLAIICAIGTALFGALHAAASKN